MLTSERQTSLSRGSQRKSIRTDVDLPGSRDPGSRLRSNRSSVVGGRNSQTDISADLAELRAKYAQRRQSESDEQSTIITATQIASMLEGDVVMASDRNKRLPTTMAALPGDARKPLWAFAQECWQGFVARRMTPTVVGYQNFVKRGYMLEATSRTRQLCHERKSAPPRVDASECHSPTCSSPAYRAPMCSCASWQCLW